MDASNPWDIIKKIQDKLGTIFSKANVLKIEKKYIDLSIIEFYITWSTNITFVRLFHKSLLHDHRFANDRFGSLGKAIDLGGIRNLRNELRIRELILIGLYNLLLELIRLLIIKFHQSMCPRPFYFISSLCLCREELLLLFDLRRLECLCLHRGYQFHYVCYDYNLLYICVH
jgi:hypothetical protein